MWFLLLLSHRVLPLLAALLLLACSPDSRHDGSAEAAMAQNKASIKEADVTERQEDDATFLVDLTNNTLLELELGKLAQARASAPLVRHYGARLVQHKMELLQDLRRLTARKNLAIPTSLGDDQQAALHEVSSLTGALLDKRLLELVIKTHNQDEEDLDDMKEDAYDGDIRGLAAKYLPPIREQLAAAEELADEIDDLP